MRVRWRGHREVYDVLGQQTHREGPRGERWTQVSGVRVGAYPDGMVYAEARAAALLDGASSHRLVPVDEVPSAATAAGALVETVTKVPAAGGPALGRLDLAADLRFEDGREGLDLLRTLAEIDLPWLKAGTEGCKRTALETVYWRSVNGRAVQLRAYDKGVESETAAPGTWLRLERQRRWRRARERAVLDVCSEGFEHLWADRHLEGLVRVPEVVRCDRASAVEELRRLHDTGQLSSRLLESLAGFVVTGGHGASRTRTYKRWAQLRDLGIALDPSATGARVVPIALYLNRARAAWEQAA